MPPISRRSHFKSRHGCFNCKQRRVKCDETRPSCFNCIKRNVTCNYGAASPLLWKDNNTLSKPSHRTSSKQQEIDIFWALERITRLQHAMSVLPAEETLLDLELMMQWCNTTHALFVRNDTTAWVWRQLVPQEALVHKFLLWELLSLSALDLSRSKNPSQRPTYVNAAAYYQTRALSLFRPALHEVNASNAKAVFAFASIVAVYGFGSSDEWDMTDPIQDLYDVLMLLRGVQQVISCVSPTLRNSEFGSLLEPATASEEIPPDARAALAHLHTLNDSLQAGAESHEIYCEAIASLDNVFSIYHSGMPAMTPCGKWAISLPPLFLEYLQERQPLALIILAHYCVLFHYLRQYWCLSPWATRVSKAIWNTLDENGRDSVRWPMEQIASQGSS